MKNQIVILAAGKGTRMGGNIPKVLVMLKNQPLIMYLLKTLEKINQLSKPIIVTGYKASLIRGVLGEQYNYAFQKDQLGTAQALMAAKEKIKAENVLVLYGDMPFITAESLQKLILSHFENKSLVSMLTTVVPDFSGIYKSLESYGRIIRSAGQDVIKIIEYKDAEPEQKQIKEINPGIYMFSAKWLWENIKKITNQNRQKEYYLTDLINIAAGQGIKINSLFMDAKEALSITTPEDLLVAEKSFGSK